MIASVASIVCFAILAFAGLGHCRDLHAFHRAIRAHALWPSALTLPLAVVVAALEATVGLVGLASIAFSWEAAQPPLLAAAAGVYASFTAYGLYLLRHRPGVPCACSGDAHPIDMVVTVRAATLTGLAVAAAASAPVANGLSPRELVVTCAASCTYALVIWALPAALQDPFATFRAGVAGRAD